MRIAPLRAALFGLLVATGCTVGDVGPNGGDGNDVSGDDVAGDDVSSDGDDVVAPDAFEPKLAVTVDKPTWMSELGSSNMVTLTLQGSDGFSGPVNIAATIADPAGAPLAGYTVELSDPVVTLDVNGTSTVVATVKVPTLNSGLAANVKFDLTSSLVPAQSVESAGTVLNQVTIPITRGGGGNGCQYPAGLTALRVNAGTKVRFLNADTDPADLIRIHTGLGAGRDADINIPHQQEDLAPGAAYERVTSGSGTRGWYCHTPGNDPGNLDIVVVP